MRVLDQDPTVSIDRVYDGFIEPLNIGHSQNRYCAYTEDLVLQSKHDVLTQSIETVWWWVPMGTGDSLLDRSSCLGVLNELPPALVNCHRNPA